MPVVSVPVSKIDETREFDTETLSEEMRDFVFAHGLKQLINDAHSGLSLGKTIEVKENGEAHQVEVTADMIREVVDAKVAAILSGQIRRAGGGGGGPRLTPYDRMLRTVIEEALLKTRLNATEATKLARNIDEAATEYAQRYADAHGLKVTGKTLENLKRTWHNRAEARLATATDEEADAFGK